MELALEIALEPTLAPVLGTALLPALLATLAFVEEATLEVAAEVVVPAARGSPANVSVLTSLPVRLPPCFWNSFSEIGGKEVAE